MLLVLKLTILFLMTRDHKEATEDLPIHYVYRHLRLDTGEIFYIGVGTKPEEYNTWRSEYGRAIQRTITSRNSDWMDVYKSTQIKTEIVLDNLTLTEAFNSEKFFIALYGRADLGKGLLVNWTNGGGGPSGRVWTDEDRRLASELAKQRPPRSKESIEQARQSMLETVARRIECIETGEIFAGVLRARDELFPTSKHAHKQISNACNTGRPYKRLHFRFLDAGLESVRTEAKRGEGKKNSILNEKIVSEIKKMFNDGKTVKTLASTLNVSMGVVSSVVNEKTWRWVEPKITRKTKAQKRLQIDEIIQIKGWLLEGQSTVEIAERLGICYTIIQQIQAGKTHKNVGPAVPPGQIGKLSNHRTEIMELYLSGTGTRQLAERFHVHISSIQRLVSGKTWKEAA